MDLFLRTQERVRSSRGKRAIRVRTTEVLLYFKSSLGLAMYIFKSIKMKDKLQE